LHWDAVGLCIELPRCHARDYDIYVQYYDIDFFNYNCYDYNYDIGCDQLLLLKHHVQYYRHTLYDLFAVDSHYSFRPDNDNIHTNRLHNTNPNDGHSLHNDSLHYCAVRAVALRLRYSARRDESGAWYR
jgi:hypothetical protein